jgi:hypothetical protein
MTTSWRFRRFCAAKPTDGVIAPEIWRSAAGRLVAIRPHFFSV